MWYKYSVNHEVGSKKMPVGAKEKEKMMKKSEVPTGATVRNMPGILRDTAHLNRKGMPFRLLKPDRNGKQTYPVVTTSGVIDHACLTGMTNEEGRASSAPFNFV